ncbi:unnamed protein product [Clonostachys rosea]|uniref:Uncharacterized protein n=1 Tax=Bionectria ochroleuca TaxID=29856 RepID=A0ABY6U9S0_BIOOC|nr:unnamed protein product [Clonostachys rosea]
MASNQPGNSHRRPSLIPQPNGSSRRQWARKSTSNASRGSITAGSAASVGCEPSEDGNIDDDLPASDSASHASLTPAASPRTSKTHRRSFKDDPIRQTGAAPEQPPSVPPAPNVRRGPAEGAQRPFYPEQSWNSIYGYGQPLVPMRPNLHIPLISDQQRAPAGGPPPLRPSYPSYPPHTVNYATDFPDSPQMSQQQGAQTSDDDFPPPPRAYNKTTNNANHSQASRNLRQRLGGDARATGGTSWPNHRGQAAGRSKPPNMDSNLPPYGSHGASNGYFQEARPAWTGYNASGQGHYQGYPYHPPNPYYNPPGPQLPADTVPSPVKMRETDPPPPDPEKLRLQAELKAFKAAQEQAKATERQRELEAQIRKDAEHAFQRRMEDMRKAQEEAKREIEKAREEAERAMRERVEAEAQAQEERRKAHAELVQKVEQDTRRRLQAELEASEEMRRREAKQREEIEDTALRRAQAMLKAEEDAKMLAEKAERERAEAMKKTLMEELQQLQVIEHERLEEEMKVKVEMERAVQPNCNEVMEQLQQEQEVLVQRLTVQSMEEITSLGNDILLELKRERKAITDLLMSGRSPPRLPRGRPRGVIGINAGTRHSSSASSSGSSDSERQHALAEEDLKSESSALRGRRLPDGESIGVSTCPAAPDPPTRGTPFRNSSPESVSMTSQPPIRRRHRNYSESRRKRLNKDKKPLPFPVEDLANLIVDSLMTRLEDIREREMVFSVDTLSRRGRSLTRSDDDGQGLFEHGNMASHSSITSNQSPTTPKACDSISQSPLDSAGFRSYIEVFPEPSTERAGGMENAQTAHNDKIGVEDLNMNETNVRRPSDFGKSSYSRLRSDEDTKKDGLGLDFLRALSTDSEDAMKEFSNSSLGTWDESFMDEDLINLND